MPPDPLITWSALLARWTEFAQSALALPKTGPAARWREAVPHIISLQAVTQALAELATIDHPEIPLALDRSELTIRHAAAGIDGLWQAEPLPPELADLIADARLALAMGRTLGFAWVVAADVLVADHPGELSMALAETEMVRDLLVPSPGVPLFATSPAAHLIPSDWNARADELIALVSDFLGPRRDSRFSGLDVRHQVYRQFDFAKGGPVRDLVLPTEAGLPAGQPLLVPAITLGAIQPVSLPPRTPIRLDPLPVVHEGPVTSDEAPGNGR